MYAVIFSTHSAVGESQPGGQSSNAVVQRDIRDDQAMGQQNLALPGACTCVTYIHKLICLLDCPIHSDYFVMYTVHTI